MCTTDFTVSCTGGGGGTEGWGGGKEEGEEGEREGWEK